MSRRDLSKTPILAAALTATLGLLLTTHPATAQTGKIGVLNTEAVFTQSKAGKTALAVLNALRQDKQREADAKTRAIQELRERMAEGQNTLSQQELAGLQASVERKSTELRRFQEDGSRELQKRRNEELAKLDQKVMPMVNAYAREQGYSMIFRKYESGLVYADDAIDITAEIIQRLDAQ